VDDIEDCYGGIADFPLTDAGRQTAKALADKLANSKIELLYTSPYRRAAETASQIANALDRPIKTIPDLRERNSYGVLSGVNKAKAKEIFAHVLSQLRGKPGDYYTGEGIPGDEPVGAFNARVKAAFTEILSTAQGKAVVGIVTHGNVTRSVYRNILGVSGKVDLDLLAVTVIDYSNGKLTIESSEGISVKPG
jgi:broad specificity phosphatase PhoE